MNLSAGVKDLKILANGHLRTAKALPKFRDQYVTLRAQNF
jgi:hypothetical protein